MGKTSGSVPLVAIVLIAVVGLRELGEAAQPDVSVRHAVIAHADAAGGHNFERQRSAAAGGWHDGDFDANSRQRWLGLGMYLSVTPTVVFKCPL